MHSPNFPRRHLDLTPYVGLAPCPQNPGLLNGSPSEMRSKLEGVAAAAGCDLPAAAKFLTKLPAAWNRSPEALKQVLVPLFRGLQLDDSIRAVALPQQVARRMSRLSAQHTTPSHRTVGRIAAQLAHFLL